MDTQRHIGDAEIPTLIPTNLLTREETSQYVPGFDTPQSEHLFIGQRIRQLARERFKRWRERMLKERAKHWRRIHAAEGVKGLLDYVELARLAIGVTRNEGPAKRRPLQRAMLLNGRLRQIKSER